MYYLAKFCRICIQTSENLVDIEDNDFDSIKFSEKLKACTEMVITRESLSTQICVSCVNKLRISYQFRNMCKNSTSILQQYLTKLLNNTDKIAADSFFNSELHVTISSTLPRKPRRKRVGKEERCSLLRKLLSKITQDQLGCNTHIKELTSLCDRIPSPPLPTSSHIPSQKEPAKKSKEETIKGGLKNLLSFTKDFNFGYDISNCSGCKKYVDLTPLENLIRFTETFFYDHFNDFRETILFIQDNIDFESSDDEGMFDECNKTCEEVGVKQEFIRDQEVYIKSEIFTSEEYDSDYDITTNYVQACYETENVSDIKIECHSPTRPIENDRLTTTLLSTPSITDNNNSPLLQSYLQRPPLLIDKLFNQSSVHTNYTRKQRTFWPYSIKCRTRSNPFINPHLKDQFLARNFKCSTCSRQFKSPGYLKAHCSKLRH